MYLHISSDCQIPAMRTTHACREQMGIACNLQLRTWKTRIGRSGHHGSLGPVASKPGQVLQVWRYSIH